MSASPGRASPGGPARGHSGRRELELEVALRRPSRADRQVRSRRDVTIAEETELTSGTATSSAATSTGERVRTATWRASACSQELRRDLGREAAMELSEFLGMRQVTPEFCRVVLGRADVDGFDLLARAGVQLRAGQPVGPRDRRRASLDWPSSRSCPKAS